MIHLSNYSSLLPKGTLYGNLDGNIASLLNITTPRSDSPLILKMPVMQHCGVFSLMPSDVANWCVQLRSHLNKNEDYTSLHGMVIDTGVSTCATSFKSDFIGPIEYGNFGSVQTTDTNCKVNIEGRGIIRWKALDALGRTCNMECIAHYILKMSMPLFSPQSYCQFHHLDKDTVYYGGNSMDFFLKTVDNRKLQIPIDGPSNLPIILVKPDKTKCNSCDPLSCPTGQPYMSCSHSHITSLLVFDETNQNITRAQRELLLFRHRLAHLSFMHVQSLMRCCLDPKLKSVQISFAILDSKGV